MATPIPAKERRYPLWIFVLASLGVSLLIGLSLLWYRHHRHYVWTNDAYLDGYQISIASDINARIITLYVDEGDLVQKGQLLCQLDESIYNSQKLDAETSVALLREQVALQKIQMEKLQDIYLVGLQEYEN